MRKGEARGYLLHGRVPTPAELAEKGLDPGSPLYQAVARLTR